MSTEEFERDLRVGATLRLASAEAAQTPALLQRVPRPIRFILVGVLGLVTDLSVFTIFTTHGVHPLLARLGSLAVATIVTWRLNRALTFDETARPQAAEAMRYGIVTLLAQATSYAVFSALVLSIAERLPQAAVIVGAAVGTAISYRGHRLFAFAPTNQPTEPQSYPYGS
jgi:putative flippase GtrA